MELFDKLKKKKEFADWGNAYKAAPNFYSKPDGTPFGVFALTEKTTTILLKAPQSEYRVDGNSISDWRIMLVSISKDSVIGDIDYFTALKKAEKYVIDENDNSILIKGLSLSELESLM